MKTTLRNLLDTKNRSFFVNRTREIELFERMLQPENKKTLLFIIGLGGAGKSSLLSQFRFIAQEEMYPIALADLYASNLQSPINLLAEWRKNLSSIKFPEFDNIFTGYQNFLINSGNQLPDKPSANLDFEYQITNAFIEGINTNQKTKPPILMLDSFERAQTSTAEWLSENLLSSLRSDVRVVIAGRHFSNEIWSSWTSLMTIVELGVLDYSSSTTFLKMKGIDNKNLVNEIYKLSNGLPLALSLISDSVLVNGNVLPSTNSNIIDEIVNRFYRGLTDETKRIIEVAAVLGEFNFDSISNIYHEATREAFEQLKTMSFVRNSQSGYVIHDAVRHYILQYLESFSPSYLHDLEAQAKSIQLSSVESLVIRSIGNDQVNTSSDIAIQSQTLQGEIENVIRKLKEENLLEDVGESKDGEALYSLTDKGNKVFRSFKETLE